MKNQKGFSLIELLVVVIIIAIIAAIAIPSLLASRRAANQASAVANLRTVVSANATHASLNSGRYGATFLAISTADYLDDSWTGAPVKNGYTFTYSAEGTAPAISGYCVVATSTAASGDNAYAVSHQGVIYQAPVATPPTCATATGVISGGTVVGS